MQSAALSRRWGAEVWLKLEGCSPAGSHKDREAAAIVRHCRSGGIGAVGCASTGNLAVALALHSMVSGLACHVWLPEIPASPEVVQTLGEFGARVERVAGSLDDAYDESSRLMAARGIFDANPGQCDLKLEANAGIAREIVADLDGVDLVVVPVNNGSHLLGVDRGLGDSSARLFGAYTHIGAASSIAGLHQREGGARIRQAVARRGGELVEVWHDGIRDALCTLFAEGVFCEPASAAAVALLAQRPPRRGAKVCCVITGSGIRKPPDTASFFLLRPVP